MIKFDNFGFRYNPPFSVSDDELLITGNQKNEVGLKQKKAAHQLYKFKFLKKTIIKFKFPKTISKTANTITIMIHINFAFVT